VSIRVAFHNFFHRPLYGCLIHPNSLVLYNRRPLKFVMTHSNMEFWSPFRMLFLRAPVFWRLLARDLVFWVSYGDVLACPEVSIIYSSEQEHSGVVLSWNHSVLDHSSLPRRCRDKLFVFTVTGRPSASSYQYGR